MPAEGSPFERANGDRAMSSRDLPTASFFKGVRLIDPEAGVDQVTDLLVSTEGVRVKPRSGPEDAKHVDAAGLWALPGLVDIQVHSATRL